MESWRFEVRGWRFEVRGWKVERLRVEKFKRSLMRKPAIGKRAFFVLLYQIDYSSVFTGASSFSSITFLKICFGKAPGCIMGSQVESMNNKVGIL